MGPIIIFDKSFLQSLNLDEAVWLDHFFLCNICPLFYVETLSDIEKTIKKGRSAEQVVGEIASKFPELHGMPSAYHLEICIANLLGNHIPMTGQIPIRQGRPVKVAGKSSVVVEPTPEAEAFSRWQKGDFLTVERNFARFWRNQLKEVELHKSLKLLETIDIDLNNCKNLETVKLKATDFFHSTNNCDQQMRLTLSLLNVPQNMYLEIVNLWTKSGNIPLSDFAPYTAYVMIIELFFLIAMKIGLISYSRASNKIDISYIHYLPFSMVFVSSDKLHRRCVPLFLRKDQEFIWGLDLKADLSKINQYYSSLAPEIKEKGIDFFAPYPPQEGEFLVTKLWDRYLQRNGKTTESEEIYSRDEKEIVQEMNRIAESPSVTTDEIDFDVSNPDSIIIKRVVQKKKGTWYQLPKDIK